MSQPSGASGRRGIVTAGTWCADRNKSLDFWPEEDRVGEILLEEPTRGGGSACNLATDVKRLDPAFPVETIGLLGDDADGRLLRSEAETLGIGIAQLRLIPGVATHYADCFASRRSGKRTHIYFQGASARLTPDHFDFSTTAGRILHLGILGVHRLMDQPWGGEPSGWVAVLRRARAAGLLTNLELASIEPARIAALVRPCLPHLDLLVVNDSEIGAIAGMTTVTGGVTDVDACRRAAEWVLAGGVSTLAVVHFPSGAVAVDPAGATFMPSVDVPAAEIAGANGAGDAFAAGLLYGFHEGWALSEALTLAHAVAAASLRDLSTSDAVEPWRDCLARAERWGRRAGPAGAGG
jgi:sugar/nucleoside kinase (ribokinase family)